MEKKILLAVDGSNHSARAVDYASEMFTHGKDFFYTILHVQPMISEYLLDEAKKDARANAELKKLFKKNEAAAHELVESYRQRMLRRGVAEDHIAVQTQIRMVGVVKDILEVALKGMYDAIVVGRRGLGKAHKLFAGSVSSKLLEHAMRIPVWMVDGPAVPQRFLVAIDGSESSYRAVDYLSDMLASDTDFSLTLMHVPQSVQDFSDIEEIAQMSDLDEVIRKGDKLLIEGFYELAQRKFREAGIRSGQVRLITPKRSTKIGKMINEEAETGNYGTVVVGRRGTGGAFFFGSVSRYVAERLSGKALWLIS
jgi:nucleotide-binding universal stress UspA family protein